MRKLLNLFPLILPLCLIALIGSSSANAAFPTLPTLAQQPPPCVLFGDFSEDGEIDVADIMQVANKWRCKCGDGCYGSRYDIDNDCDIDIVDIMRIGVRWGDSCEDPLPPIEACGSISQDTTWTTGNVYLVACDVTVNAGVTLTVQRGVVVKFNSGRSLAVNGSLLAQGTDDYGMIFTSWRDDTYGGDTNGDSNATLPARGDWLYIYLTDSSVDAAFDGSGNYVSGSVIQYAIIEYGGGACCLDDNGALRIEASAPYIDHNTIRNNKRDGIHAWNSPGLRITNNSVTENGIAGPFPVGSIGIYVDAGGTSIISGNTVSNNTRHGIEVSGISHDGTVIVSGNIVQNNIDTGIGCKGIYVVDRTVTVSDNTVTSNMGVGIDVSGTTMTVSRNVVSNNTGCGIHVEGYTWVGTATISGNTITGNAAPGQDGGGLCVYMAAAGTATITDNIISGNSAGWGGGAFVGGCGSMTGNIIVIGIHG